jgi:hypothetical protein
VSDGSEREEEPDPATRKWDESEVLDDKYKEPDPSERFDIEPNIPEAPSAEGADPQLQMRFWSLVVIFNIAIITVSVGGMLMFFRENVQLGLQLFLAGVVISAYGFYRYRTAKETVYDDQNG